MKLSKLVSETKELPLVEMDREFDFFSFWTFYNLEFLRIP